MPTDLGSISTPLSHTGIALNASEPHNEGFQLYYATDLTQQVAWVPSGPKL